MTIVKYGRPDALIYLYSYENPYTCIVWPGCIIESPDVHFDSLCYSNRAIDGLPLLAQLGVLEHGHLLPYKGALLVVLEEMFCHSQLAPVKVRCNDVFSSVVFCAGHMLDYYY